MKLKKFILIFIFGFNFIFAQNELKNVAVLDFQALGISEYEAVALAERFRLELFNTKQYTVLERGKMDEILKEQGFQNSGCTTDECLVEMGRLINVQYMFGGSISKFGDVFTVMIKLIDVETSKIVQTQAIDLTIKKEKLMTEGMKSVAGVFAGKEMAAISTDTNLKEKTDRLPSEPEMVFVKGGTFMMGDVFDEGEDNEKPVHEVTLDDFYIGKYEITFDQYFEYCEDTGTEAPDDEDWGHSNQPVINISWQDAMDYCRWLSDKSGKNYSLPTEAQWEYAARSGGKKERFAGTSQEKKLPSFAWFEDNSNNKTHPIGTKLPNKIGVFDLNGNVAEWCLNNIEIYGHQNEYKVINPKIIRGGYYGDSIEYLRNTFRYFILKYKWPKFIYSGFEKDYYDDFIGFRVVIFNSKNR